MYKWKTNHLLFFISVFILLTHEKALENEETVKNYSKLLQMFNVVAIATQQIENYVSIEKNLYQKLCWQISRRIIENCVDVTANVCQYDWPSQHYSYQ